MPSNPYPQSRVYSMEEIAWVAKLWWKTGMLDEHAAIAVAIAMAESGGNIYAHNTTPPDDSYGLWQINMYGSLGPARRAQFGLPSNEALYTPAANAQAAWTIWRNSGLSFRAWSTYKNGDYKRFLDDARAAVKNPKQPSDVHDPQEGDVDTHVLGVILDPLFSFIKDAGIRVAGFVGGAALLITATVILAKRGVK